MEYSHTVTILSFGAVNWLSLFPAAPLRIRFPNVLLWYRSCIHCTRQAVTSAVIPRLQERFFDPENIPYIPPLKKQIPAAGYTGYGDLSFWFSFRCSVLRLHVNRHFQAAGFVPFNPIGYLVPFNQDDGGPGYRKHKILIIIYSCHPNQAAAGRS